MSIILDLFFPKLCVSCKKEGAYLCLECLNNIEQADLVCPKCEKFSFGGFTHPICKRKFGLEGLWSLGVYQGSLKRSIQALKYRWITGLLDTLSGVLFEYWVKNPPLVLDEVKKSRGEGWVVVSVPLHWYRYNWRGFNQSQLLGQALARALGVRYCDALKRIRFTTPQVKLRGWQRSKNIKGAFKISASILSENILLVDDVWTTGATIKECCYILKRNGAKRVWALTLAK